MAIGLGSLVDEVHVDEKEKEDEDEGRQTRKGKKKGEQRVKLRAE